MKYIMKERKPQEMMQNIECLKKYCTSEKFANMESINKKNIINNIIIISPMTRVGCRVSAQVITPPHIESRGYSFMFSK